MPPSKGKALLYSISSGEKSCKLITNNTPENYSYKLV